jgi:hypothetical protein
MCLSLELFFKHSRTFTISKSNRISIESGPNSGHEEAGVESVSLGEYLLLDLVDLGLYGLLHLGGADHHAHSATLLQLSQVQLLPTDGQIAIMKW